MIRIWFVSLLAATGFAAAADLRLVDAAQKGDKDAVRTLLKQRADVNARQSDGATPLVWAAYHDDLDIAEVLLGAGANVNAANDYGITPLALACDNGSAGMVDRLLKAVPVVHDAEFMKCVRTGSLNAVKALLTHGAKVNTKESREDQTALMWAAAEKHTDIVRLLIEFGADVKAHTKRGFTALMFAVQQNDLDAVKALLAAGANLNEATTEGDTPMLVAAESGHEALAIFLLDRGADPNAADENGFTALHFAFMKGLALINRIRIPEYAPYLVRDDMLGLTKALLAHGADPNPRIKKWSDKLHSVIRGDPFPGSGSSYGATPFLLAALGWDAEGMRILAAGGADPKARTEKQPGIVIGKDGFIEASVKAKLAAAGVIEPAEVGPWEVNALMMAAGLPRWRTGSHPLLEEEETRALEAVKVAVGLGVDVNAVDTLGLTALHGAAFQGSHRIIQYLVEKGANLNAKDMSGQTSLHKALNIKPTGTYDQSGVFTPTAVQRSLIPLWTPEGTAEFLLKLGATPVDTTATAAASK